MGDVAAGQPLAAAFDRAARSYDLMVALNPGYHRHLRTAAAALTQQLPRSREWRLIDLGCGSGASTRALLRSAAGGPGISELIGVDASAGMLATAAAKDWPSCVRFDHRDAADLGADLEPVHGMFAAYLFRNAADPDRVLAGVRRLLEPGGTLVVQEYSVAGRPTARAVWTLVCWAVVIPLSWLISRDTRLYRYLWRSVLDFDAVEQFCGRLIAAGFVDVEVRTVPGWQHKILHTFRARRPQ